MFNFLKNLTPTEIALIALIFIILFGAKIVTGLGKVSGEIFREIKKVKNSFTENTEDKES